MFVPIRIPRGLSALVLGLTLFVGGAVQAERPPQPVALEPQLEAATSPGPLPLPPIADVPLPAPAVPLLWKITGGQGSLYLLGSFHFLKPDDYPLSADVEQAFAAADEVVFELSPEELQSPTLAMQMMQAGLRTSGGRLDDDLGPGESARLADWTRRNADTLQATGMGTTALQMFEPWFASLLVTTTELGRYGLQASHGLDVHLAARAREAGKPTAGLETASEQIGFLDGMDTAQQVQMLVEALDQAEAGPAAIEALHATWRAGDADTLWTGMAGDMRTRAPGLYARINTMRNDAWLPRLEQMLQQGGEILVVVGALHLLGEDGVVEKLAAKGYVVERICSACEASTGVAPAP